VCVDACPNGALYKEEKYGAVLLDEGKCKGKRECWKACPYAAILYENDEYGTKASKCTMCIDRLEQGMSPICVMSCSLRALDFGPLEELQKKYGTARELADMPSGDLSKPAVVFKPRTPHKNIVPFDSSKAISLWQQRGPNAPLDLPPVFNSKSDITDIPAGVIFRDKLVLRHKNVAELMRYTLNDD
jgi:anaerobic dimethyl sulfoxide reductase subunit B (iron-sulfur subunit)